MKKIDKDTYVFVPIEYEKNDIDGSIKILLDSKLTEVATF